LSDQLKLLEKFRFIVEKKEKAAQDIIPGSLFSKQ